MRATWWVVDRPAATRDCTTEGVWPVEEFASLCALFQLTFTVQFSWMTHAISINPAWARNAARQWMRTHLWVSSVGPMNAD